MKKQSKKRWIPIVHESKIKSDIKRICLWSSPRNISTALMYSFANRSDTQVVDEPLYAHYLTVTNADTYHPGAAEVLESQENDGVKVVSEVIMGDYSAPVVFFKNMTHHLIKLDQGFLKNTLNVILTREPGAMISSFIKQIPNPVLSDTGYPQQLRLLETLKEIGQKPLVVDSADILKNPKEKLTELCDYLGIAFEEAMLEWNAGPRPEDGIWAKYWYQNVHASEGFQPYEPKSYEIPDSLQELVSEARLCYEKLITG